MNNIILIIGTCGTGKTWVMKQLIDYFDISHVYHYKTGLYTYLKKGGIIIVGKYENTIFDGSDRLSMSIMKDNNLVKSIFENSSFVFLEGDRFTNSTFIEQFKPFIIKIEGDGKEGRALRGSNQTERHIKSITTRVNNITPHISVNSSKECFEYLINKINAETKSKEAL